MGCNLASLPRASSAVAAGSYWARISLRVGPDCSQPRCSVDSLMGQEPLKKINGPRSKDINYGCPFFDPTKSCCCNGGSEKQEHALALALSKRRKNNREAGACSFSHAPPSPHLAATVNKTVVTASYPRSALIARRGMMYSIGLLK